MTSQKRPWRHQFVSKLSSNRRRIGFCLSVFEGALLFFQELERPTTQDEGGAVLQGTSGCLGSLTRWDRPDYYYYVDAAVLHGMSGCLGGLTRFIFMREASNITLHWSGDLCILLYVHLKNDDLSTSLLLPLNQVITLSLPKVVTYPHCFLTAYILTSCASVLAGVLD